MRLYANAASNVSISSAYGQDDSSNLKLEIVQKNREIDIMKEQLKTKNKEIGNHKIEITTLKKSVAEITGKLDQNEKFQKMFREEVFSLNLISCMPFKFFFLTSIRCLC